MGKRVIIFVGLAVLLGALSTAGIYVYSGFFNPNIVSEFSNFGSCTSLKDALVFDHDLTCPEGGETRFSLETNKKITRFKLIITTYEGEETYEINGENSFPELRTRDSQFGEPLPLPAKGVEMEYFYKGIAEKVLVEEFESGGLECSPFEMIDFAECDGSLSPLEGDGEGPNFGFGGSGKKSLSSSFGGIAGDVVQEESTQYSPGTYGAGVAMDSLANTHAGSPQGAYIVPSFGFEAEHTGQFTSFIFHHAGGIGYANGTGGIWKAEVYANNVTSNTPTGPILSSKVVSPNNNTLAEHVILDDPVSVVKGQIYHIVFRNIDLFPDINYFSVDNVYVHNPYNETFLFPKYHPDKLFHQYQYNGVWTRRYNFLPILEIRYEDQTSQGMSYDEIQLGLNASGEVGGSNKLVREVINVSGGDKLVSGIGIRVLKIPGTTSPLIFKIKDQSGNEIVSANISADSISNGPAPPASCGCTYCDCVWNQVGQNATWAHANFSSSVVLQGGQKYYAEFSSSSGTYWFWSIRHFIDLPGYYQGYNFSKSTAFTDGYAQKTVNGGLNWTYLALPYNQGPINNLQFYFSTLEEVGDLAEENSSEAEVQASPEESNFQFSFTKRGLLLQLNWTQDGENNTLVWDEKSRFGNGTSYYPHSLTTPGYSTGWTITYLNNTNLTEEHASIEYDLLNVTDNSAEITADTSRLGIVDSFTFFNDTYIVEVAITNKLSERIDVKVPVYLGGLEIGNLSNNAYSLDVPNTDLSLLRSWKGGQVEENFNNNGYSTVAYPKDHDAFSPVAALWDDDLAVGVQYLEDLDLPDYVEFASRAKWAYRPTLDTFINVELDAGEEKSFEIVYKVSDGGQDAWKEVLQPYKDWFYSNNNEGNPEYCPASPFAYFGGNNIGAPLYDADSKRYSPNTSFMEVFASGQTLENIQALELEHYGIWAATLWSSYICPECGESLSDPETACTSEMCCEFSPNSITLDPNLDVSSDSSKLDEASEAFLESGARLFWYTRPCSLIELDNYLVSEEDLPLSGNYVNILDLRDESAREVKFAEYDYLYGHGIRGFYIDYLSCPGEEEFIEDIKERYEDADFILREGSRDKTLLRVPQIPIVKFSGDYPNSHSELIEWLVPHGSYYLGNANEPLTDSEMEDALDRGYQPIVANSLGNIDSGDLDKYKSWICKAYVNQLEKWESYGSEIGCAEPQSPSYCDGETVITGGVIAIRSMNPKDEAVNVLILLFVGLTIAGVLEIERRRKKKI